MLLVGRRPLSLIRLRINRAQRVGQRRPPGFVERLGDGSLQFLNCSFRFREPKEVFLNCALNRPATARNDCLEYLFDRRNAS
jgi:hypothetical protein